jgi:hypothetical protein
MPHYFFNVRTMDDDLVEDEEGLVLPGVEAAGLAARVLAARFAGSAERGGLDYTGCYFEVTCNDGRQHLNAPAFVVTEDAEGADILLS